MSSHTSQSQNSIVDTGESEIRRMYHEILDGWNAHDADAFAAPFTDDGVVIGFDGSQMIGRADIASTIGAIFTDHVTATYVSIVKRVRRLGDGVAALQAVVGMVPPGQSDITPAANAHQTLIAVRSNGVWRAELFQNTPAQFHDRPELVQQMTDELRQALAAASKRARS